MNGLFGGPVITVVIGREAHPTLMKSLACWGWAGGACG